MSNELKCKCQHCNGHIQFQEELIGQTLECPNCHLETLLYKPQAVIAPRPTKTNTGFILAAVFAFLLLGIILYVSTSKPTQQKPTVQETRITSAGGWTLGDVLPASYQTEIDDETIGIKCKFSPPPDLGLDDDIVSSCYLILTEDRRIAAISFYGRENNHFNFDILRKVLEDKYGPASGYTSPQGTTLVIQQGNREVRLIKLFPDGLNVISLTYMDDDLKELADTQKDKRIEAKQKQIQDSLKGHF